MSSSVLKFENKDETIKRLQDDLNEERVKRQKYEKQVNTCLEHICSLDSSIITTYIKDNITNINELYEFTKYYFNNGLESEYDVIVELKNIFISLLQSISYFDIIIINDIAKLLNN